MSATHTDDKTDTKPHRDYLKYADHPVYPSFHFRTGKTPILPFSAVTRQPANEFGFPLPGAQSPTAVQATAAHYFADQATWNAIVDHGEFDDVVCGSGFCALAYASEALARDPMRKILILERGGKYLTSRGTDRLKLKTMGNQDFGSLSTSR